MGYLYTTTQESGNFKVPTGWVMLHEVTVLKQETFGRNDFEANSIRVMLFSEYLDMSGR